MHLGGWNNADSPPPSPEVPSAGASSSGEAVGKSRKRLRDSGDGGSAGGSSAAKARIDEERIASMGLQKVDTVALKSVVNMARNLTTGGYALYLGTREITALCSPPPPAAATDATST